MTSSLLLHLCAWLVYFGGAAGWVVSVHRHPYWRVYPWYGRPYALAIVWPGLAAFDYIIKINKERLI